MRFFITFILNFCLLFAFGQDQIAEKMSWYGKAKPNANLFVHFDKNVYSNNETVYFTGYLLNTDSIVTKQHHVLSIALIRDADTAIIVHDKFLMEDGLSFGNILLLDSILTGNYHFIAYTDKIVDDIPEFVFVQPIIMKTSIDPFFNAGMKLLDDKDQGGLKKILLSITSKDGRFLPKPTSVSYRYGTLNKITKTDPSGQVLISLPEQKNLIDPNLYLKLKYGNDSNFISMAIPREKNKASVKFYPEGGNLIEGLPSVVGWEVKDQQKMPVALTAYLYRNNEPIDTIETSSYGIGKFRIFPIPNATYTVKLLHSALTDSVYALPKPLTEGLALSLPKAVVNDTLRVSLKTNRIEKFIIRIHNFRNSFFRVPFQMQAVSQTIKIPLDAVPKGLATITITDSLDRPLAERIFFAHYGIEAPLFVSTDKETYGKREKINLKIRLADQRKQGIVSIACIQNNRLDLKKLKDIASFSYLTNELYNIPTNLKGNPFADQNYMEQILLVKGWRKYSWQELEQASDKITIPKKAAHLIISGYVTHPRKKLLKTDLVTVGGSRFQHISTDSLGHFSITNDQLITPAGNKLYLIFDHEEKTTKTDDYKIKVNDPYPVMNAKLAKLFDPEIAIMPSVLQNNQSLILKNNERSIQLKEVVINPYIDDTMTYNACGDYVCQYQILNCPNHPKGFKGNKPPVAGKYYKYQGFTKLYEGCNKLDESIFFKVKPLYLSKEFYINDFHDPLEPAFVSTIYWNYATILKGNKEVDVSFYTSDITGRFRVVAQGITNNDVVYAECFFEVK